MSNATISELKEANRAFLAAYASINVDELRKWADEGLTFGHASGRAETREEFIAGLVRGKTTAYSAIVPVDERVTLIDNVAVVHQSIKRTRSDGRTRMDREMVVWLYKNGQWRLISRQGVKVGGNAFS